MDDTSLIEERGVVRREKDETFLKQKAALVRSKEEEGLRRTITGIKNKIRMKMNLLQYLDLQQEIKTVLMKEIEELQSKCKNAGFSNSLVLTLAPTLTPETGTALIPAQVGLKELDDKDFTAKSIKLAKRPSVWRCIDLHGNCTCRSLIKLAPERTVGLATEMAPELASTESGQTLLREMDGEISAANSLVLTLAPTLTPETGTVLIPAQVGLKELDHKDFTAKSLVLILTPTLTPTPTPTLTPEPGTGRVEEESYSVGGQQEERKKKKGGLRGFLQKLFTCRSVSEEEERNLNIWS